MQSGFEVSASQLLWRRAGSPRMACEDVTATCWLCGAPLSRGQRVSDWMPSTFTAQNRARCLSSEWICEACVWATAGKPPDTLRMYSHLVDDAECLRANKGQKPEIRAFLRREKHGPWFAAIADSGQKHVVPWAPINPPGSRRGRVLFEEQMVTLGDFALVDELVALLTAGATKEEIERGDYGPRAWQLCGAQIEAFESQHGGLRGGSWFALAVWLAQRDEEQVAARMRAEKEAKANAKARQRSERAPRQADGGAADGGAARVPRGRRKSAEALGPDHGPAAGSGEDVGDRARVDDGSHAEPATRRPVQVSLFGD